MGSKLIKNGGTEKAFLADEQIDWPAVIATINEKQFNRTAQLLNSFQIPEHSQESYLEPILASAQHICHVCQQVQAEIELHQRAYQNALHRERELQQQLTLILDFIEQYCQQESLPAVNLVSPAESQQDSDETGASNGRSWWQRLRNLFERKNFPQTPIETINPKDERTAVPPPETWDSQQVENFEVGSGETAVSSNVTPLPQNTPILAIYCLGPFRVYQDNQLITDWNGIKGQSIFKFLISHKDKPITKDTLMETFWPEASPEAARRNLHQAIYSLRQVLKIHNPDYQHIQFKNDCYTLNPEMQIWIDWDEFTKHIQAGHRLETSGQTTQAMTEYGIAEGLYQNDFLEEDTYEEWTIPQRRHMRRQYLDITNRLSAYYVQQGQHTAAIAFCQKALKHDSCYEDAHHRLMQCYLAQKQRHLAVRQYHICQQVLKEELDISPSEEIMTLYQLIVNK